MKALLPKPIRIFEYSYQIMYVFVMLSFSTWQLLSAPFTGVNSGFLTGILIFGALLYTIALVLLLKRSEKSITLAWSFTIFAFITSMIVFSVPFVDASPSEMHLRLIGQAVMWSLLPVGIVLAILQTMLLKKDPRVKTRSDVIIANTGSFPYPMPINVTTLKTELEKDEKILWEVPIGRMAELGTLMLTNLRIIYAAEDVYSGPVEPVVIRRSDVATIRRPRSIGPLEYNPDWIIEYKDGDHLAKLKLRLSGTRSFSSRNEIYEKMNQLADTHTQQK